MKNKVCDVYDGLRYALYGKGCRHSLDTNRKTILSKELRFLTQKKKQAQSQIKWAI